MKQIAYYQDNGGEKVEAKLEITQAYLTIYGSGWITPDENRYNLGKAFEAIANARHKINEREHPNSHCVMTYCPTDIEFFDTINNCDNIVRLDIYCHGWAKGLNLGGFKGKRIIREIECNSDDIDWTNDTEGRNLRRVIIEEIDMLDPLSFNESPKIYFWGCNIGGQLTLKNEHVLDSAEFDSDGNLISPKECFAQKFAERIGKGNVYALVGKGESAGGSVFKTDKSGKNFYDDGEMIPANISKNHKEKNTKELKAIDYMKGFPL